MQPKFVPDDPEVRMSACIQCGSEVENAAITGVVCLKCSNTMTGIDKPEPKIDPLVLSALVVGGVAFAIKFEINGRNYIALSLGPIMVILGIVALARIKSAPQDLRNMRLGTTIGAILLGVYHVIRGLG